MKQVDIPIKNSSVGVLAKHVPIIGRIVPGKIRVTDLQGKTEEFDVTEGTIAMNPDGSLQVLPSSLVREGVEPKVRTGSIRIQKWRGGQPMKEKKI